jgi:DNA-binding NarL/FixJ family response regulator
MINCNKLPNPFTEKQMPVLIGIMECKGIKVIASELKRPFETVRSQVKSMQSDTGARNSLELAMLSALNGWACRYCTRECPFGRINAFVKQ